MRTTLDIDDELLVRAKEQAARQRTTLTRLIEEGLALRLTEPPVARSARRRPLAVFNAVGGLLPAAGEGLSNRALLDAADGT